MGGTIPGWAQYELTDPSKQKALTVLPDDSARVNLLVDWAYDDAPTLELERKYASLALQLASQIGYAKGRSSALVKLGHLALDAGDYLSAEEYYLEAAEIRTGLKDRLGTASCFNSLGQLKRSQGQYDSAIEMYRKGLSELDSQIHLYGAYIHNGLGVVYQHQGLNELALDHFERSSQVYKRLKSHPDANLTRIRLGLATVRVNIGAFLQENLNQYKPAQDSLLKSLSDFDSLGSEINQAKCLLLLGNNAYYSGTPRKAIQFYDQGVKMNELISTDDSLKFIKNRGRMHLDLREYKLAANDFKTSLSGFKRINNQPELAATCFELGNYYYELDQLDSAVLYYRQGLLFDFQNAQLRGQLLYFLADALDQNGQKDEASGYTDQYIELLNGLNATDSRGAFNQLINHQLDKNRTLKRFVQQEKETFQYYSLFGLGSLLLLLLLSISIALLNREKRQKAEQQEKMARQAEELARKNEQIALQEKLDLIKQNELETHYARLEGQEEMQQKIGQELHDGIGTMLSTVKINLAPVDEVLDNLPENKQHNYKKANILLDEACVEVRRIAHELSSAVLTRFGLRAQLEALADVIENSGRLQVELSTHQITNSLNNNQELNLYRIVQELVNNTIKHAQASRISIQVNRFDEIVNIVVEDNGKGFDLEKIRENPGIGLRNIKARVHDLKGEVYIDAKAGRGTTVSIDIPFRIK